MPLIPSNYSVPSISVSSYGKISSLHDGGSSASSAYGNGGSSGYFRSLPLSNYSSSSSLFSNNSSTSYDAPMTSHLPPPVPMTQRRVTPVRRAYTANLEGPYSSKKSMSFQARPLKNLTVLSQSRNTPVRSITRSPSPSPSISSCASVSSRSSCPPRRVFPQVGVRVDLDELEDKEESPVVFDANLTFVLGCKGKMKQNVRAVPAYMDQSTASNYLTNKISDFLERTDHVMDEWKSMGHKELENKRSLGKSRSATNIMIKGFQYFSRASSCRSSVARELSEDRTEAGAEEVVINKTVERVVTVLACLKGIKQSYGVLCNLF